MNHKYQIISKIDLEAFKIKMKRQAMCNDDIPKDICTQMYKILKKYDKKTIPIWCSLPTLAQPLTRLVEETLTENYGFDARRINEFKEKCQGIASKAPDYNLLFILDSYDEIQQEFQYKNLY